MTQSASEPLIHDVKGQLRRALAHLNSNELAFAEALLSDVLAQGPDADAFQLLGVIRRIEVDTAHFKGNFPDRCSLQAARVAGGTDESLVTQAMFWPVLLPEQPLRMDSVHTYEAELASLGPVTHVRFNIFPDGGVSRLRLWGAID